jgi:type IV pilus assembly protein PilP
MRSLTLILGILALVGGCSGGAHDDLNQFVRDSGKEMRGKVDPLPEVKPYQTFTYEAFDLPDPFRPRKLSAGKAGGLQPNLNRPREPLENYAVESLKFVGTLEQSGAAFALVKTPDNVLYRVKKGNYMGQNFGVITNIEETGVTLKEIVLDTAGDWAERVTTINLQD